GAVSGGGRGDLDRTSGGGRRAGRRLHRGRGEVQRRRPGREGEGQQGHGEVRDGGRRREGGGGRQQGPRQRRGVGAGGEGGPDGEEDQRRPARLQVHPPRGGDHAGRGRVQELRRHPAQPAHVLDGQSVDQQGPAQVQEGDVGEVREARDHQDHV